MDNPRIASIGTAVPPTSYTQAELAQYFGVNNRKIQALFSNSHIEKRHLTLPVLEELIRSKSNALPVQSEDPDILAARHRQGVLNLGSEALRQALHQAGLAPDKLDYIACVTSTGFLCPGASALLTKELGLAEDIFRLDIVGMGCNAAMNALQPLTNFLRVYPDKTAALVCIENCSAAYVVDEKMVTAVVNSLFGDACVALILTGSRFKEAPVNPNLPEVLDFESQIVTEAQHTMRFEHQQGRLSFFLDKDIPYFLGQNAHKPVRRLWERHNLKKRDISWWLVHSGGKKVIDSIKMNLGLSDYDLRHTISILAEYGNISSCSVLWALKRLSDEAIAQPGDLATIITMGPGASIETALLRW
ncbi:MAG: type III polyketide synthase [Candidatus Bruticola sp.]